MCVAVTYGAVESDQREQSFQILVHIGRVGKLLEALYDRGFIAAPVFLLRPAGVEHAEILEAAVGAVRAKIEAINDEGHTILRETIGRNLKSASFCDREAEVFVCSE